MSDLFGLLFLFAWLAVLLVTPLYVTGDAKRRGSDHWLAWGVMSLFGSVAFWIVWVIFYLRVRDEALGSV